MIETIIDEYIVKIGENQKENDLLVKKSAPNDYWLHISDYSSAHGVIQNPNNERINNKIIKKVCMLIKMKSNKCKSIHNLKFSVTKIKNLTTTKVEGQVIINDDYKTISI